MLRQVRIKMDLATQHTHHMGSNNKVKLKKNVSSIDTRSLIAFCISWQDISKTDLGTKLSFSSYFDQCVNITTALREFWNKYILLLSHKLDSRVCAYIKSRVTCTTTLQLIESVSLSAQQKSKLYFSLLLKSRFASLPKMKREGEERKKTEKRGEQMFPLLGTSVMATPLIDDFTVRCGSQGSDAPRITPGS